VGVYQRTGKLWQLIDYDYPASLQIFTFSSRYFLLMPTSFALLRERTGHMLLLKSWISGE